MKRLLLVFAVMAFGFTASAQKVASATAESISKGKTTGTFVMQLPDQITAAQVEEAKSYYTSYFTVNFDPGTHQATIALTNNEPLNRKVITRFLITLQVETVNVGGKTCPTTEVYETFLK